MKESTSLDELILETLRQRSVPQDPVALIEELAGRDAPHEELRRAIWRLVGRKQLEFTIDWKLRAVPASELVPA